MLGMLTTTVHDFVLDKEGFLEKQSQKNISTTMDKKAQYPIPTHLKKILIPYGNKNSSLKVNGKLKCTCGGDQFIIKTLHDKNSGVDGSFVKVVCRSCKKDYLIFDAYKHGWDGFVCKSFPERIINESDIHNVNCKICNSNLFTVKISISSQGPDDFVEETGIQNGDQTFQLEEWVNAFEWITIIPTCIECGEILSDFISFETM